MSDSRSVFAELEHLVTEQRNPRSQNIDTAEIHEILTIISDEDRTVADAVRREIPYIEQAVEHMVSAIQSGGRLFYAGAGTSGRLGILDASECPPTFGTPPYLIQGIIAGGPEAMFRSKEGAEDIEADGAKAIVKAGVCPPDIVCGIAASRRTPFVHGAIRESRSRGCKTLFVTCTSRTSFNLDVDIAICTVVGPEVIMGSTRMKAGTAQKMVLNMLTTATMIRLGKVYQNMMVDLQMGAEKLVERSKRTIMLVTGLKYAKAAALLAAAEGHVKTALVMHLAGVSCAEARRRLDAADGFVRLALQQEI